MSLKILKSEIMLNIENESKFTLTKNDYEKILSSCKIIKKKQHINAYYDSNYKLLSIDATCRIRLLESREAELTLKIPVSVDENNVRKSQEFNYPFTEKLYYILKTGPVMNLEIVPYRLSLKWMPEEIVDKLQAIDIKFLEAIGSTLNVRHVLDLNGLNFELDYVTMPNNKFLYELEIEENDLEKQKQIITEVLNIVPDIQPSKTNKYQKFIESINK